MTVRLNHVVEHLRKLVVAQAAGRFSDRQLLERFACYRDEEAFSTLVQRHGAMVLHVCRRVLDNITDAEDACQATFLVLARKAHSIRKRDSLASWLHGVAYRAASSMRRQILRRQAREKQVARKNVAADLTWHEGQTILDEEIQRLPDDLKSVILLCCLEGRIHNEAAQHLGVALSTLRGRLERARDLLRKRLTRRGLTLSGALLASALVPSPVAAMPAALVVRTLRAALTAHVPEQGILSAQAFTVAKGVTTSMLLCKLKFAVPALCLLAVLGIGVSRALVNAATEPAPETVTEVVPAETTPATTTPVETTPAETTPAETTAQAVDEPAREPNQRPATAGNRQRTVVASCRVDGTIIDLPVEEGDKVRTGDVLARLDDRAARLGLQAAEARLQLASAESKLSATKVDEATRKITYMKRLVEQKAISAEEYKDAVGAVEKAQLDKAARDASLKLAKIEVERARLVLDNHVIRSPVEGTVQGVLKQNGEGVKKGETLLHIRLGQAKSRPRRKETDDKETSDDRTGKTDRSRSKIADLKEIRRLMKQLSSTRFSERDTATKRLEAIGEPALEPLRKAVETPSDLETMKRAATLIEAIERRVFAPLARLRGHTEKVTGVALSPDGKFIASSSDDTTVRLWDAATGKELRCLRGHSSMTLSVAFTPDGKHFLSTSGWPSGDKSIRIWETATGREVRCLTGHTDAVWKAVFSPDGRSVLSASRDNTLRLWEVFPEDKGEVRRFLGHSAWVRGAAFSPDGRRAVSGSWDHSVRLWDIGTGQELRRFDGHQAEVNSVAFSPDGKQILSGGGSDGDPGDAVVRLWDADTGKLIRQLPGHTRRVWQVTFSPDGRRALSSAADGTIRLWDIRTGRQLMAYQDQLSEVRCAVFTRDGRRILSGSDDKVLRFWPVPR